MLHSSCYANVVLVRISPPGPPFTQRRDYLHKVDIACPFGHQFGGIAVIGNLPQLECVRKRRAHYLATISQGERRNGHVFAGNGPGIILIAGDFLLVYKLLHCGRQVWRYMLNKLREAGFDLNSRRRVHDLGILENFV